MGLYRYSDENKRYENEEKYSRKEEKKEEFFCDPESARTLKKIVSLLEELNDRDLHILDEIIHRAFCIRSKDC